MDKKANVNVQGKVGNRYKLRVLRPDGEIRAESGWSHNVVTDHGMDVMGTSLSCFRVCVVGTGNSTPSPTDNSLDNQVAETSDHLEDDEGLVTDEYYWGRQVFTFEAGVAEGNLAEVGTMRAGEPSISSRALILDSEGNPTTITVLSDELLEVTFEYRFYIPQQEFSFNVEIAGVTHAVTARAQAVGSHTTFNGWGDPQYDAAGPRMSRTRFAQASDDTAFPALKTANSPDGSSSNSSSNELLSYVLGSKYLDTKFVWAPDAGNFTAGIGLIMGTVGNGFYAFLFDPPIMKTDTDQLELTMRVSWDNAS